MQYGAQVQGLAQDWYGIRQARDAGAAICDVSGRFSHSTTTFPLPESSMERIGQLY